MLNMFVHMLLSKPQRVSNREKLSFYADVLQLIRRSRATRLLYSHMGKLEAVCNAVFQNRPSPNGCYVVLLLLFLLFLLLLLLLLFLLLFLLLLLFCFVLCCFLFAFELRFKALHLRLVPRLPSSL